MKEDKGIQSRWLKKLSKRSLIKIKVILLIVLSELEITGANNKDNEYAIPYNVFNEENFTGKEAKDVIQSVSSELSIPIKTEYGKLGMDMIIKIDNLSVIDDLRKVLKNIEKLLTNQEEKQKAISYDLDRGILLFNGAEFDFSRKYNQKELLAALFTETSKEWSYDEIIEAWGEEYQKGDWRKGYTACNGINNTIALKLGINDFIVKNTKQIRINPKYI